MPPPPEQRGTRTALLLGATGLVGGHCLRLLLADPIYRRVTAVVRRSLPLHHERLVERVVEFDRLREHADLFRVDDIFCCLGSTIKAAGSREAFRKVDFEYPAEAARVGHASGAHRFLLVSSLGANPRSSVFYSRTKGETEAAIMSLPFTLVAMLRPSMLTGDRREFRLGEALATPALRALSFVLPGRWKKYRPISAEVVSRALCAVATSGLTGVHVFESDTIQQLGDSYPARDHRDAAVLQ